MGYSIFLGIAVSFLITAEVFAACDEPYGLCMSQCVTSSAPERCMQRCQHSLDRCSKSGVFQMPVGFKYLDAPWFAAQAKLLVSKENRNLQAANDPKLP